MSITYLAPGQEIRCGTGEITIRAIPVRTREGFRLALNRVGGEPFDGPSMRRSDRLVLPVLTGGIEIVVTTAGPDALFGPDARFRLLVDVISADGGFDQVHSPEKDLSGLHSAHFLSIDAGEPGGLLIRSTEAMPSTDARPEAASRSEQTGPDRSPRDPGDVVPPGPAIPADDDPLVRQARAESRARVGAVRAPRESLRAHAVVLDQSASMGVHHRSGAVAAVLRSLAGLSQVFATDTAVPVWTGGPSGSEQCADLSGEPMTELLDRVYSSLASGFSIASAMRRLPRLDPRTVFVLTDDYPPDLPDLSDSELAGADGNRRWHVIVFGRSRNDFRVVGSADRSGPAAVTDDLRSIPERAGVLLTSVLVDSQKPLPEELLRPQGMRALIGALTRGDAG